MSDEFAVLILTNNRPDRVYTYQTLRKHGYTGRIVLVIDDLDTARDAYFEAFGDQVVIFDKKKAGAYTDSGDNFGGLRGVVYARNAAFEVAESLGIKYFIVLDDDYTSFQFRFDDKLNYGYRKIVTLDHVFAAMLKFFKTTPTISLAMAQGGDFIGGDESQNAQEVMLTRKCMNSFICSTDRPFKFMGRINEDVNAYVTWASMGMLFFTTNQLSLQQKITQTNAGGLTEIYLDLGTYVKSFYSVMYHPSSVSVKILNSKNSRLHHSVNWKHTAPKILSEKYKKWR